MTVLLYMPILNTNDLCKIEEYVIKGIFMNQSLAKAAQVVQNVLQNHGLVCQVKEFSSSTRTAQDAAASIGCDVAQIIKSLIFKTADSHQPVLVLVSGPNRVNEKVIESYVGEKIMKADADFVRDVTGFAIGGVPPIGHKQQIDLVFVDQDLLSFDNIWAAAGTPNSVFNLSSKDFVKIISGKIINLNVKG